MSRRAVNRAAIMDAIGDDEFVDDPDAPVPGDAPEPEAVVSVNVTSTPAAPVQSIGLTAEQLQSILSAVLSQSQSGNAALAEAVQESVARARQKMPENETHSGASTLNPSGGPKPTVRMPVWHGLLDPRNGQLHPMVPVAGTNSLENMCSVAEIEALNTLRPTEKVNYELTNGATVPVRVIEQKDGAGEPWRLVIVWPEGFFTNKDQRNFIGRIPQMVAKLQAAA